MGGRYASYWNASLFSYFFCTIKSNPICKKVYNRSTTFQKSQQPTLEWFTATIVECIDLSNLNPKWHYALTNDLLLQKTDVLRINVKDTNYVSLKECFLSPIYLSYVFWVCLLHLRVTIFLGTMVPWLVDIFPDDDDRGN